MCAFQPAFAQFQAGVGRLHSALFVSGQLLLRSFRHAIDIAALVYSAFGFYRRCWFRASDVAANTIISLSTFCLKVL